MVKGRLVVSIVSCILTLLAVARPQPLRAQEDVVWPNAESKANSDDWIRLHHNQIRQMRPKVLVLNFVNGLSADEAQKKAERITAAIREGTRYHANQNPDAKPFLDYKIYKVVSITDPAPLSESQRMDGNSSLYPRVKDWKPGQPNFQYSALFSEAFAGYYKEKDPNDPARMMSLDELVTRGKVHEVWILAQQSTFGSPLPMVELKQAYDATLRKIKDKSVQAGVGPLNDVPFIGRSLRIAYINNERGPGCAMETLGVSLEALAESKAIPYFTRYFNEYAGFDLKTRYNMPFESFLKKPDNITLEFTEPSTLQYSVKGELHQVKRYYAVGGSARFTPNSLRPFDINSPDPVMSSIENYRMKNGNNGADKIERWTSMRLAKYQALANDCVGPWIVYWWQNMPGLDNKALDEADRPMKNWWPFLFY